MKNLLLNNKPLFPETSYLTLLLFTGVMMCYYHGWSKLMVDSSIGGNDWKMLSPIG